MGGGGEVWASNWARLMPLVLPIDHRGATTPRWAMMAGFHSLHGPSPRVVDAWFGPGPVRSSRPAAGAGEFTMYNLNLAPSGWMEFIFTKRYYNCIVLYCKSAIAYIVD